MRLVVHDLGYTILSSSIISLAYCGLTALMDSFTPAGIQTSDDLEYFLLNPEVYM